MMLEKTLRVPTVSCDHCKHAIEGAVGKVPGVAEVVVEVGAKQVKVSFDPSKANLAGIVGAIEEQGYDVASETG